MTFVSPPGWPPVPPTDAPAAKSARKRLPLVIGALTLAVVLTLGVGGFFVYSALLSAPQPSPAQFGRIESVNKCGDQPADFTQGAAIEWNWFGSEERDLPVCQGSSDFYNEHVVATYHAASKLAGGVYGDALIGLNAQPVQHGSGGAFVEHQVGGGAGAQRAHHRCRPGRVGHHAKPPRNSL